MESGTGWHRAQERDEEDANSVLTVQSVSKHFGGVYAVDAVSIECRPDEIVGLIGPNGAGKTTLLNLISGTLAPDRGEIHLGGQVLHGRTPRQCARAGVARTFQNIRLFTRLTVRQNVEVSASVRRRHRSHAGGVDFDVLFDALELDIVADRKAGTLPYGHQRRTEIARAVALAPAFLLLDEPAAGMNETESAQLADAIRTIRDLAGCGVVVIDHDLRFIMGLCDRIYVLHDGRVICHGDPESVKRDPKVKEVYLGTGGHNGKH